MQNLRVNPRITILWTAFCLAAWVGVFWLPYRIPNPHAVFSDASLHGCNNKIAVLAALLLVAGATLLRLYTQAPPVGAEDPAIAAPMPSWPLRLVLGIQAVALLFQFAVFHGGNSLPEPGYFTNRLYCLKLGMSPYRDFEFVYGPLMLYPADWTRRLLHVSIDAAYVLMVGLSLFLGIILLWLLLQRAHTSKRTKMFLFFAFASIPSFGLALQYTLLRFLIAAAALLALEIFSANYRVRWMLDAAAGALLTVLVFATSPEMGIAFVAGLMAFWLVKYFAVRALLPRLAAYVVLLLCLVPFIPREVFRAVLGFSNGGNNLPIVPSVYMLLYLGTLWGALSFVFASVIRALSRRSENLNLPFSLPLTAGLAVLALFMMPGAMGRLDAGHVVLYGTILFLLAFLLPWKNRFWKIAYAVIFLLVFDGYGLTSAVSGTRNNYSFKIEYNFLPWIETHPDSLLIRAIEHRIGRARWQKDLDTRRQYELSNWYQTVAPHAPVCVPLEGGYVAGQLLQLQLLKPEFFYGTISMYTPDQAARKIQSLQSCQFVVLPSSPNMLQTGMVDSPNSLAAERSFLRHYLWWPWIPPATSQHPAPPRDLVLQYLQSEYIPISPINDSFTLYEKRSAP